MILSDLDQGEIIRHTEEEQNIPNSMGLDNGDTVIEKEVGSYIEAVPQISKFTVSKLINTKYFFQTSSQSSRSKVVSKQHFGKSSY